MRNDADCDYLNVVLIKHGTIQENFLFVGNHQEIVLKANSKFLSLCEENISNWDEYTPEDIEDTLDEGYAEFGHGCVLINWPDVEQVESAD